MAKLKPEVSIQGNDLKIIIDLSSLKKEITAEILSAIRGISTGTETSKTTKKSSKKSGKRSRKKSARKKAALNPAQLKKVRQYVAKKFALTEVGDYRQYPDPDKATLEAEFKKKSEEAYFAEMPDLRKTPPEKKVAKKTARKATKKSSKKAAKK